MEEVYKQLFCLFVFTITGISIGILFDIFRILRKSFKTVDWITYIQDILFWILTGIIILFSIFQFNNGEVRGYIFIGIILGVLLYMLTISKYLIKCSVTIINLIKKIISYPINLIKNILKKVIVNPIVFVIKKVKSSIVIIGKEKQKMTKNIKNKDKKHTNLKEKEGIL